MISLVVSLALCGQSPSPPHSGPPALPALSRSGTSELAHTVARRKARADAKAASRAHAARAAAQRRREYLAREERLAPLRAQQAKEALTLQIEARKAAALEAQAFAQSVQAAAQVQAAEQYRREEAYRDRRAGYYVGPTSGITPPGYRPLPVVLP